MRQRENSKGIEGRLEVNENKNAKKTVVACSLCPGKGTGLYCMGASGHVNF